MLGGGSIGDFGSGKRYFVGGVCWFMNLCERLHRLLVGVSIAVCCVGILHGQVTKITDPARLSANAVPLEFGQGSASAVALDGAPAGKVFERWGITFRSDPPFAPVILTRDRNSGFGSVPMFFWFLSTGEFGEGQGSQPLVVDFQVPLKRVLFRPASYVGPNWEQEQVVLKAFDSRGTLLGTVEQTGISGPIGLETASPYGISKVLFDYPSGLPESIEEISLDYLEGARAFTTYLTQIGAGNTSSDIAGVTTLLTSFVVSNPSNIQAQGQISFFDNDGQPLVLSLSGAPASTIDLLVGPLQSTILSMDGTPSTVITGYAVVRANVPLDSLAIFSVYDASGVEQSNADISAAGGVVSAVAPVQRFDGGRLDSGLAIVNTGQKDAELRIGGQGLDSAFLELSPGEHVAQFLSELFPSLASHDYEGTIRFTSSQPVAVVVLRTRDGVPVSAVPVGSLQR